MGAAPGTPSIAAGAARQLTLLGAAERRLRAVRAMHASSLAQRNLRLQQVALLREELEEVMVAVAAADILAAAAAATLRAGAGAASWAASLTQCP